jgi:hypothetical protein
MSGRSCAWTLGCLCASLLLVSVANAEEDAGGRDTPALELTGAPTSAPEGVAPSAEPAADPDAALSGDEIYRRVLDNRFDAYEQTLRMKSGDRSGQSQQTRLQMKYKSFDEKGSRVLSKTIAKYLEPQDVRHLGYLVVNKREGADDQFVYRPSSRRVRRVNLRGEAVFGTDFSFEDIIPQEFEDATYRRLPDVIVGEIDCFSVEVTPTEAAESEYSKFVVHVHKTYSLPIETLYWDDRDVHTKVLTADPGTITRYEVKEKDAIREVWIARHSRIVNLQFESFTELDVLEFEANPKLRPKDFSERKLTSSR